MKPKFEVNLSADGATFPSLKEKAPSDHVLRIYGAKEGTYGGQRLSQRPLLLEGGPTRSQLTKSFG